MHNCASNPLPEENINSLLLESPSVGAYSLTQLGLRRAESSLVATYIYLQPMFATLGAVIILHEPLRPQAGLAAALIFMGVWVSTRPARSAGPPSPTRPDPDSSSPHRSRARADDRRAPP